MSNKTPSFSSLLLDSISRSIDPNHDHINNNNNNNIKQTKMNKTRSVSANDNEFTLPFDTVVDLRLQRSFIVDSWIDNHHLHHPPEYPVWFVRQQSVPCRDTATTTCSLSSKIRAKFTPRAADSCFRFDHAPSKIFAKSKSRVSKSPPVSPRKRIAAFLNSIFRNSVRRTSISPASSETSTSSSFSTSYVSKTTSSIGKSSKTQRSPPDDVITDENRKSSSHRKNVDEKREIDDTLMKMMMIVEKNYDDEDESCASSDLFELENLNSIGEDLPLYGTTSLQLCTTN